MSDVLIFNKDDQEDEFWHYVTEIKKMPEFNTVKEKLVNNLLLIL